MYMYCPNAWVILSVESTLYISSLYGRGGGGRGGEVGRGGGGGEGGGKGVGVGRGGGKGVGVGRGREGGRVTLESRDRHSNSCT